MAAVKKVGQKNGEVGLLVEYLFCASTNYVKISAVLAEKFEFTQS